MMDANSTRNMQSKFSVIHKHLCRSRPTCNRMYVFVSFLSVRPPAWNISASIEIILMKFDVCSIFRRTVGPTEFSLKSENNGGYFTWEPIYRVIHKSLRKFRTRLPNNQDRNRRKEISSTCKVGQTLAVSLPLLTCSPSEWPSRLLYRRGWTSRRDLWITTYIFYHILLVSF
jgi:hypothetical protein